MISKQGWINLYKPKCITSFKAINSIKKKFSIDKIGHAGTLDPMACLLYTSPSPRDRTRSRMPSSA